MTWAVRADDVLGEVWQGVADFGAHRDQPMSVGLVCAAAPDLLEVSGASVTLATDDEDAQPLHATDTVAVRLQEIESATGQGPRHESCRRHAPLLVSDLSSSEHQRRWPRFTPQALQTGARAVFVFPLHVGAIRTGLLTLHRTRPELLSLPHIRAAFALADMAFVLLLHMSPTSLTGPSTSPGTTSMAELNRAEIHQACGKVAAELGVGLDEALVWLRTRAVTEKRPLAELARDVLGGGSRSSRIGRGEAGG